MTKSNTSTTPQQDVSSYDLVVIGGGSGGLAAAKRAAQHGASVALVEEREVGGTCVVRGCVPKKLLVYAGRLGKYIEDAKGYGWNITQPVTLNWGELVGKVQTEVARLTTLHEGFLEKAGVTLIRGHAAVSGPHEVRIANNKGSEQQILKATKILIAVGGSPQVPALPGITDSIVSDDMFLLEKKPQSITIVGGGYIALEFASLLHACGVNVTVLVRGPRILREFDQECAVALQTALQERGITIATDTSVQKITTEGKGVVTSSAPKEELVSDAVVFFATGRRPNTDRLQLDTVGVEVDHAGAIVTNDQFQTSCPSIWALGDCTNRVNLTPVAIDEGRVFSDRVFGKMAQRQVNYEAIPTAIFTTPEFATVGLSEQHALKTYGPGDIQIFRTGFRPLYESLAGGSQRVFMKILVHRSTDKVVGVHVLGPDAAAEIIQLAGVALTAGATKEHFDRTMALHPSSAEELVTLYTPSKP